MIVKGNERVLFDAFNAAYLKGFDAVAPTWSQVAQRITSTGESEIYGWMNDLPGLREWIGQRVVHDLSATTYQVFNKRFEETVGIPETKIEDDQYGAFSGRFNMLGESAALHPDRLVWGLLPAGFDSHGYDGQFFFDADHAGHAARTGAETSWSNVQTGTEPAWYLLDLSRNHMRPFIFQERRAARFIQKDRPEDDNVFMEGTLYYGVDMRCAAAYGFHQLAYGSKGALDKDNYEAARTALYSQYKPDGTPLGIKPTHLVVPPQLEGAARELLEAERTAMGATNVWRGSAQLIVSPYLS